MSSTRSPWVCSKCLVKGVSMATVDCLNCDDFRCIGYNIKANVATGADINAKDAKLAAPASFQESSSGDELETQTSAETKGFLRTLSSLSSKHSGFNRSQLSEIQAPANVATGADIEAEGAKLAAPASFQESSSGHKRSGFSRKQRLEIQSSVETKGFLRTLSSLSSKFSGFSRSQPSETQAPAETPGLLRIPSHFVSGAIPTIKLVPSGTEHPCYVLRETSDDMTDQSVNDSDLISAWHRALPSINQLCLEAQIPCVSLHLFRMGPNENVSTPTIIANFKGPLEVVNTKLLTDICASSLSQNLSFLWKSRGHVLQLMVKQSHVRRSVNSTALPPICEPRNRKFQDPPRTGDSIGIGGSLDDTASLGCYLRGSAGQRMALTVDHLIPAGQQNPTLTHISEQDSDCLKLQVVRASVRRFRASTGHICQNCAKLWQSLEVSKGFQDFVVAYCSYSDHGCEAYDTVTKLPGWRFDDIASNFLGAYISRSGTRARIDREMDWALFDVSVDLSLPLSSSEADELVICPTNVKLPTIAGAWSGLTFNPGALVKSRGRTSGYQLGQISTTAGLIFHGNYTTEEWCVLRRPETPVDEWIEGGIGVDGDSGALIVDEVTNLVYGMLWGRTGDGASTVTIFTPIREIMRDIEETTGERLTLIKGQLMDSSPGDATTIPVETSSVPITLRPEDDNGDEEISAHQSLGAS